MYMRKKVPSFFLMNETGAPHGEKLVLMKPLSNSSSNRLDSVHISDGANRYGDHTIKAAPGVR